MSIIPTYTQDAEIRALSQEIVCAPDPAVKRIVAVVDKLASRGPVDALIEPLRQRLRMLRPPRPLRFVRLMFHPLGPLIVPARHWRLGQITIPRTVLRPMADHVRQAMGDSARAIEAEIAGRTTADLVLIGKLGPSLWPAAAEILADAQVPETWATTGLTATKYRPLADSVAVLLGRAVPLDRLCAETANGLLPPGPEAVGGLLDHVAETNSEHLAMLIALLLARLPEAAASLIPAHPGPLATRIRSALDQASDRLLRQLNDEEGTEIQMAAGTLADAGAVAARIAALLKQFDTGLRTPPRRDQLRTLRQRLDACCKARFTMGLEEELLTPLQNLAGPPDAAVVRDLEAAARGLRVLEIEARGVGSGALYDLLLRQATAAVMDSNVRDRLNVIDQVRLVEVLSGPDAAMAMVDSPG